MTKLKEKYGAIIIGGGIGGLVCGCYLARAGMRVLIIEKHNQVGGYCTSFFRNGYYFDAAVHSLRGLRPEYQLGIIFRDLNLSKRMQIVRTNPSDIIQYKNKKILILTNPKYTVESFKMNFPGQPKEIDSFFSYLTKTPFPKLYKDTYKITFRTFMNKYFKNIEIKAAFNILLGNLGFDSYHLAAISALVFLNELITDGGYYPLNGIGVFPNVLAQKFVEYGGEILLNTTVRKIKTSNNRIHGIFLQNNEYIKSNVIVSNADATMTYTKLLDTTKINRKIIHRLSNLKPSPSALIVYLGIKGPINNFQRCCTLWHFPLSNADHCYEKSISRVEQYIGKYVICGLGGISNRTKGSVYGRSGISLTAMAPWKSKMFWDEHKTRLSERMINLGCSILGINQRSIETKVVATPHTLYKFTNNNKGALYGWASTPRQINKLQMPQKSNIEGMYLCGHWATRGWGQGGVSMVANSGRTTAELVLKQRVTTKVLEQSNYKND